MITLKHIDSRGRQWAFYLPEGPARASELAHQLEDVRNIGANIMHRRGPRSRYTAAQEQALRHRWREEDALLSELCERYQGAPADARPSWAL